MPPAFNLSQDQTLQFISCSCRSSQFLAQQTLLPKMLVDLLWTPSRTHRSTHTSYLNKLLKNCGSNQSCNARRSILHYRAFLSTASAHPLHRRHSLSLSTITPNDAANSLASRLFYRISTPCQPLPPSPRPRLVNALTPPYPPPTPSSEPIILTSFDALSTHP